MAHLIDKDALLTEIKRRIKTNKECMLGLRNLDYYQGKVDALNDTLSSLDTLDVKDVNLEKELIEWHKEHFKKDGTFIGMSGFYLTNSSQMDFAKHFFELGLNTSIPLTWEDIKLIWTIGDEIPYMPEEDFFKELLKRFKAQKGKKV